MRAPGHQHAHVALFHQQALLVLELVRHAAFGFVAEQPEMFDGICGLAFGIRHDGEAIAQIVTRHVDHAYAVVAFKLGHDADVLVFARAMVCVLVAVVTRACVNGRMVVDFHESREAVGVVEVAMR